MIESTVIWGLPSDGAKYSSGPSTKRRDGPGRVNGYVSSEGGSSYFESSAPSPVLSSST